MLPRLLISALLFAFVAFAGAFPHIRILNEGDDACSKEKIERINQMILDAKNLASSANDTLYKPNVAKSSGFVALFGPNANPIDIANKHFVPFNMIPDVPKFVSSVQNLTAKDLTFTCPTYGAPKDTTARMSTRNWDDGDDGPDQRNNLIRIYPSSFEYVVPDSTGWHVVDTLSVPTAVRAVIAKTWFDEKAVPMGFTLVHEMQHADAFIGTKNHCIDVKYTNTEGKTVKAYGLQQAQRITAAPKVVNAQNYAWFAFLSLALPKLFTDECQPGLIPPTAGLQKPLLVHHDIARRDTGKACQYIPGDFLNIVDTEGEF